MIQTFPVLRSTEYSYTKGDSPLSHKRSNPTLGCGNLLFWDMPDPYGLEIFAVTFGGTEGINHNIVFDAEHH